MFQSQKSILEGFMGSLLSKDVIIQFRWGDRIDSTSSFKQLKNVQVVLLSAMVRVDPNYTLFQFENDVKAVLTKYIKTSRKKNNHSRVDTEATATEVNADETEITTTKVAVDEGEITTTELAAHDAELTTTEHTAGDTELTIEV